MYICAAFIYIDMEEAYTHKWGDLLTKNRCRVADNDRVGAIVSGRGGGGKSRH